MLLGGAMACVIDDDVVRDIGVVQLFFVDPGLVRQSVPASDPDFQVQVAEWVIQEATLELSGNVLDLLFGEDCGFVDTTEVSPIPDGACASGLIIDSNSEPTTATLNVTFTMRVRRAEPVDPNFDDGDGLPFGMDNCPLIDNPGQEDEDSNGIGDACRIVDPLTGADILDNDSDGVADNFDNCVWIANPTQADTMGVQVDGTHVPDGIGDACVEQVADVRLGGKIQVSIQIADFLQPQQPAFLVVDFTDSAVLQCDWVAGTCALDDNAVQLCLQSSLLAALFGCS